MAVRKPTDGGPEVTAHPNPTASPQQHAAAATDFSEPKKKKKKKKYRRFSRFPQEAEFSMSKGMHRLARAVEEGLFHWRKETRKSSLNRRDGAIKDALANYGKAMTKFSREASKLPEDFTKSFPKLRKIFRG
jgi:hypothetical protein